MTDPNELVAAWSRLMAKCRLGPARAVGNDLIDRYSEPHRVFHTREHLAQVTRQLETQGADIRLQLAAWFHDAVYQPGSRSSEHRSALLARKQLAALGLPSEEIALVELAIEATARHQNGSDAFAPLFDADLSILGASPDAYDRYAEELKREFSGIPAQLFRLGRIAFLRALLERPTIFSTTWGREQFEVAARRNLARELLRWQRDE